MSMQNSHERYKFFENKAPDDALSLNNINKMSMIIRSKNKFVNFAQDLEAFLVISSLVFIMTLASYTGFSEIHCWLNAYERCPSFYFTSSYNFLVGNDRYKTGISLAIFIFIYCAVNSLSQKVHYYREATLEPDSSCHACLTTNKIF